MTLSIIIPVHNTPKEIFSNCIMSIVKQKYQDFEVIVVDDGSIPDFHDQYKEICADFSKIWFKAKKQGGVSLECLRQKVSISPLLIVMIL